jgi:hypothetical protein
VEQPAPAQTERIKDFDNTRLRSLWLELFDKPAPPKLRRHLLIRILVYRVQERAYGGLDQTTRNRLRQLARLFEANPKAAIPNIPIFKPGARLVRQWKGIAHQVTIGNRDYEYKGKSYNSLSEIARLITGTRWSGPLFFGLKNKSVKGRRGN